MVFVLVIGLVLLAAAVFMIVRATFGYQPDDRHHQRHAAADRSLRVQLHRDDGTASRQKRGIGDLASSLGNRLRDTRFSKGEVETRAMLVSAGMYGTSPDRYLGLPGDQLLRVRPVLPVVACCLGYGARMGGRAHVGAFVVGWLLPLGFVKRKIRLRYDQIEYELPDLIDLLVVSIEAGLSFPGAMRLASTRVRGPLGQELRLTLQEQNMGLSTDDAMRNLYARAETPGISIFTRAIIQGQALGISMGHIMRTLAEEMRKRRKAAAEERAHKAPIKMLFPLVFLIFPTMFVVILLPAIIAIAKGL